MKRTWWHVVKHVLFGVHSPSLWFVGLCWCQRKQSSVQCFCAYCSVSEGQEHRYYCPKEGIYYASSRSS